MTHIVAIFTILIIGIFSQHPSWAKSSESRRLHHSLKEAMNRSNNEQERIRVRFDDEADQMIESWDSRQLDAIEIKSNSSLPVADLGEPDYRVDFHQGEDQSGLNRLRSSELPLGLEEDDIGSDLEEIGSLDD